MDLQARPYRDEEMPELMAEIAAWIAAAGMCGYGHIGSLPHRVYRVLRGRPAGELVRVWEGPGGRLAGVALCGLFGAGFDLLARPDLRGGPAELAMLEAAAATTRAHMRADSPGDVQVITDVYSCDELRQGALRRLGFADYRVWDDVNELELGAPAAAAPIPAGFVVRPATPDDAAGLAEANGSAFGEGWAAEEYRAQVMARPGSLAAREIVAVAPGGQIAAFCTIWVDSRNRVGLFEPVGTAAAYRRLGLARAAMAYGLDEMRRLGLRSALVAHDATNEPARALYAGLGFRRLCQTLGFREGGPANG